MNTESKADSVDCLSRGTLSDLMLGKLPAETIERIGTHIETCTICQGILDTLDGLEDSVVKDLRSASHGQAEQVSSELERQLQQAEAISHAVWRELETEGECLEEMPSRLGQYELLERLGQGGMGTVYKAIHTRLKRPVVLKVLRRERLRDPESITRFHREMEAVGQLDHPHLVRAHDAGEVEGQHYLVMEFLDGVDLARLVRRSGPFSAADACEVVRQAALGLQYAHEHGLVHRDVKPSNLMLTLGGQVKVLDLGLARLSTDTPRDTGMTTTGQVLGTGDFMAPEQGQDTRQADARSDIYSLGCTLFFLLAGQAPFSSPERDTLLKKVLAHLQEPVPLLGPFRQDLPEAIDAILARMLAKAPSDRFPTAAKVAEELAPWAVQADLGQLAATAAHRQDPKSDERLMDTPDSRLPSSPTVVTPPSRPLDRAQGLSWKRVLWVLLLIMGCLGSIAVVAFWATRNPSQRAEGTQRGRAASAAPRLHKQTTTPHGKQRGPVPDTTSALQMESNPPATSQAKSLPEWIVNSIGMKLCLIPAGEFVMGSPGSDVDALPDEKPRHRVVITSPFYLGQCEVTVGQFRQFIEASGYRTEAQRAGAGGWQADQASSKGRHTQDTTWENPGYFQTDEHPATVVTWNDAVAFCQWLSKKEGGAYRLPTEAEWEYACRAGTTEIRHIGSEPLEHFDWNLLNAGLRTWPVGRKKANPWGLFDMYGNAREWCADRYAADYYQNSPLKDPSGPLAGDERVVRGSCFMDLPPFIRSAKRLKWPGGERINNQGFRVARSIPRVR